MKEKINPSGDLKNQEEQVFEEQKQQQEKGKTPWLFNLEVKDLIAPITLRRVRLFQFGLLLLVIGSIGYYAWENFLRAPTGTELVNEMVDAAGGMEAWNSIQSGQFTRTRLLFDEAGSELSKKAETFFFQKTEEGVRLMVKSTDKEGKEAWVGEDDEGFWSTQADKPADPRKTAKKLGMMCDSKFCLPTCASSMAFYRFSMPFKLRDHGVRPDVSHAGVFAILDWNPREHLDIKSEPLILDVSYQPNVGKDKWRFLVEPEDKLIHKVEYYNKSDFGEIRPEEIYWSDHKTVSGITFSHKWTRHWGNGQVMEEYLFSDVDFETELTDDFFKRPEGLNWLSVNQ